MQNHEVNEREDLINKILSDNAVRRAVTRKSHYWFFSIFLGHYIQYEIALFQKEMFELTEGAEHRLIVVMAFRGSGKSTILNLSYTLWAILGVLQKKFVLIVSKTQSQAKNHLQNIRFELMQNDLLKQDLGPFESDDSSWGLSSLVLPKMGARITATSKEQSVRGIRFGHRRPDLIICDDLEDSASVQSKSDRDATYAWFTSEVLAAGDEHTNVIVLGNLLHEDSLLMHLHADALSNKTNLVFRAYPFADDNDQVLWPGKYDTKDKVEVLKSGVLDETLWNLEYLLMYLPEHHMQAFRPVYKAYCEAYKEWEKTGKWPEDKSKRPPFKLGKYEIGVPSMIFNVYRKVLRAPETRVQDRVQEGSLPQESQNRHEPEPMPAVEKPNQQDCSQQLGTDEEIYPS